MIELFAQETVSGVAVFTAVCCLAAAGSTVAWAGARWSSRRAGGYVGEMAERYQEVSLAFFVLFSALSYIGAGMICVRFFRAIAASGGG